MGPRDWVLAMGCGWKSPPVLAPKISCITLHVSSPFPTPYLVDVVAQADHGSLLQPGSFNACVEPTHPLIPTAYRGLWCGHEIWFHHFKPLRFGDGLLITLINTREETAGRKEGGECENGNKVQISFGGICEHSNSLLQVSEVDRSFLIQRFYDCVFSINFVN